jgi:hypothetical protein
MVAFSWGASKLYCGNLAAIHISYDPIYHEQTKCIDADHQVD